MLPVSVSTTPTGGGHLEEFAPITADSFTKDGIKISVGDCALFKPPKDSPPFVGMIHRLIISKEDSLSLSVSWLYRPADVKLVKGPLLEAAPNEVFYSFHRAEIPAASLLHRCKVAFLRKGVELPSGLCSLVCRRVYDTEAKCLRWLTEKDYVKERQKEVDQLLDKTSIDMYAAAQAGGRSPKTLNGPQVKPSSDSAPNSSSSYHSQAKGKKRELIVQGSDSVKRERTCKADDADSGQLRPDQMLKLEIAKITDRGGLTDFEGVDKLVQHMQPDSSMKKLDLACRIILSNVIAVTDRFDCLTRFVQLRGLPVLDDWLQQVHKGKLGDNSSPKDGDKSVDEFLLSMLRALDKLPVNLHALQTCNIGKSVNHLRTHRNSEIQKKARSLVDTWKKRVEAEMNMIDAKSGSSRGGSWPTKSVNSEVSNAVGRRNGEPIDPGVTNSSVQCSASKIPSKLGSSDKLSVGSPVTAKQSPAVTASDVASTKDLSSVALAGAGSSDAPLTTIKEDKSNSSSQSQNNSQSCSSEYGKTISCREEGRSSTAVSIGVNKTSSGVTRTRKSNNGHSGTAQGIQKEISIGKMSSEHRSLSSEKSSPTRLTSERTPDAPHVDNGNNNRRLIVRLPNTARSPACSASGGSADDVSATSGKGSPSMQVEELVGHEGKVKGKMGAFQRNGAQNVNVDTNQHKDGLPISGNANMSSGGLNCNEQSGGGENSDKPTDKPKDTRSPSMIAAKSGKSYEALFSSMNALVDSCVKVSEANVNASVGDDIGMNLLASVAAGEISRSNVSPSGSSGRKSSLPEESCSGNVTRSKQTDEDRDQSEDHHKEVPKCGAIIGHGSSNNSSHLKPSAKCTDVHVEKKVSMDSKIAVLGCEEKNVDSGAALDTCNGPVPASHDRQPEPIKEDSAAMSSANVKKKVNAAGDEVDQFQEPQKPSHTHARDVNASSLKLEGETDNSHETLEANGVPVLPDDASTHTNLEVKANEDSPSCSSSGRCDGDEKTGKKLSGMHGKTEDTELPCLPSTIASMEPEAANDGEMVMKQREDQRIVLSSLTVHHLSDNSHGNPEKKDVNNFHRSASPTKTTALPVQKSKQPVRSSGYRSDVAEEFVCNTDISTVPASVSDLTVKVDFDLNEGLPIDDGSSGEPVKLPDSDNISPAPLPFPLPVPTSLAEGRLPSVTVASAAKGPFVPPENPLRLKAELGWRGSAATSAFRPAEPRKNLDTPLCTVSVPLVGNSASKRSRPLLDFDLNVPDQRAMEEMAPQKSIATCSESRHSERGGGFNLDLNICDDSPEISHFSVSSSRMEMPKKPGGSSLYGVESNSSRDFDLNNGPGPDEGGNEAAPHAKSSIPFSAVPPVRMNNLELGNFWIPPGVSYSSLAMPPILPGRGDQSYPTHPSASTQRIMLPPGNTTFSPELYRGPVLSSSPAVGYTPTIPFQYPGLFPFETNFPLSSNSYSGVSTPFTDSSSGGSHYLSAIPPQVMRPTGMGSTQYTRPFVMSLPGSTSTAPESKKWGNQGLDLNAGPGVTELDRREERLPSALRQLPLTASQALPDEQLKMYQQMAGGMVKRKEPDGGFDGDRINHKHPPWQ